MPSGSICDDLNIALGDKSSRIQTIEKQTINGPALLGALVDKGV
jgi:hypothetical protein